MQGKTTRPAKAHDGIGFALGDAALLPDQLSRRSAVLKQVI